MPTADPSPTGSCPCPRPLVSEGKVQRGGEESGRAGAPPGRMVLGLRLRERGPVGCEIRREELAKQPAPWRLALSPSNLADFNENSFALYGE